MVPKLELERLAAKGLAQDLVAHADAKYRGLAQDLLGIGHGVRGSGGVTLREGLGGQESVTCVRGGW